MDDLLTKSGLVERLTGATTAHGNDAQSWQTVATYPCRVQTLSGDEDRRGKVMAKSTHRLFFPYGADVREPYRVTVDGVVYHVKFRDPDAGGEAHHVEVEAEVFS